MKLIVTGSRYWKDEVFIWKALDVFIGHYVGPVTLVHGDCPPREDGTKGADRIADEWGLFHLGDDWIERHPAEWSKYGKPAGMIRNKEMVNAHLDADYVLGFPLGESRGTRGCMKYAREMGLTVVNLGEKQWQA
ncbi:DUF2493 domain-containing protein [Actinomadura sp. KC216]|uniref:SLOG family protein n=1 Tax=Actinomadura sp. KC216 TaxID=2530370 RepID=UPI00104D5C43|nr:SLOG family protein [Actinomadura sp. KC216]TDB90944.1 DUF2493 domain-containing protein [Actinomadura sp. KC216]